MPVVVVAVLTGKPGKGPALAEAMNTVIADVHAEEGCELYAAHMDADRDTLVMIERWSTRSDLDAHASGLPLASLNELLRDLLVRPYDVWFLDALPMGEAKLGALPS